MAGGQQVNTEQGSVASKVEVKLRSNKSAAVVAPSAALVGEVADLTQGSVRAAVSRALTGQAIGVGIGNVSVQSVAWSVPSITLIEGVSGTAEGQFNLAATGPAGAIPGGVYEVDPTGTPLNAGATLSAVGLLDVGSALLGTRSGVRFMYTEPGDIIAVGELVSDGAPTPEQIALWLPVTGTVALTATATCRYRVAPSGAWVTGHPLYRIRPDLETVNYPIYGGPILDGFAWTIIDLQPGQTYNVEVTVTEGASQIFKTLTHMTRALPAPYTSATGITYNVSTAAQLRSLLLTASVPHLQPGDVLQLADGVYDTTATGSLRVEVSGTLAQPIYIRGTTRDGTIIRRLAKSSFGDFSFKTVSHVIVENLTLEGDGVDTPGSYCIPFESYNSSYQASYITIRNCKATGIDQAVNFQGVLEPPGIYSEGVLVYDNTFIGNDRWERVPLDFLGGPRSWSDPGIIIPGKGQCAWNNTIIGFGDAFSHAHHSTGGECDGTAVHYYRNLIRNTGDDVMESDHARRNCTFYDNISFNSQNVSSYDPMYAGPIIFARNVFINLYRTRQHKWNSTTCGQFHYNNTVLCGPMSDYYWWDSGASVGNLGDFAAHYQPGPSNGPDRSFGWRNNIMVYRGTGTYTYRSDDDGYEPCDWTHNSWYPDRTFIMPHNSPTYTGTSLAHMKTIYPAGTPIFSGLPKLSDDNITTINPWVTTITLPDRIYHEPGTFYDNAGWQVAEYTGTLTQADLIIAPGDPAKGSGAVIPNITDGYTGAAPDRGAVIAGRPAVIYGDRTT